MFTAWWMLGWRLDFETFGLLRQISISERQSFLLERGGLRLGLAGYWGFLSSFVGGVRLLMLGS